MKFPRATKLYSRESGRWLLAGLTTLVILTVIFLLIHPVFMTIDDARLRYVFAGYCTGTPVSSYLFTYTPLSALLAKLYTLWPAVPWYALYQFAMIGLGSLLIGKTVYKICWRRGLSLWAATAVYVFAYLTLWLISTILMHFEVTAAIIGTGGAALLLALDWRQDSRGTVICDTAAGVLCITACYVVQFNAFYAVCCYLLVGGCYHALKAIARKEWKAPLLHVGAFLLCLVIAVGSVTLLERQSKNTPDWTAYDAYNKYRVSFWDYDHVSYGEDPELYRSIGWSEEFYDMTQVMYFMDRRFNPSELSRITGKFSRFSLGDVSTLSDTLRTLSSTERLFVVQSVFLLALLAAYITLMTKKKFRQTAWPELTAGLCSLGGTALLVLYLAGRGRLPLRAWLNMSIPCGVLCILLLCMVCAPRRSRRASPAAETACAGTDAAADAGEKSAAAVPSGRRRRWARRFLCAGVLLTWLAGMIWSYQEIIGDDWTYRSRMNDRVLAMEHYAVAHPDNVYVYGLTGAQNYNVFRGYPDADSRPVNAVVWGSSYLYTPVYRQQLAKLGLQHLYTPDLLSDNVYLIAYGATDRLDTLKTMLNEEYGPVTVKAVDKIDNFFTVYQIRSAE